MTVLSQIRDILRSPELTTEFGNVADLDYHLSQGGSQEDYMPFGVDQPEKVAVNAAGLYALVEAVGLVANLNGRPNDRGYREAILFFAGLGDTMPTNKTARKYAVIAMRIAHATWLAGQPFRGMQTKPLDRLTRDVVNVFDNLSWEEQIKDLRQITSAAKWLAGKLNIEIRNEPRHSPLRGVLARLMP